MKRFRGCMLIGCALGGTAMANPEGLSVVNGQASLSRPDAATLVIRNSPGAILNWNRFSIQAGELTRFDQASAASAVLNRVTGADPSRILGTLQSNGRVFLLNPNGIVFGQNATIDTAHFVASTLDMSDADFIAGRLRFEQGSGQGSIVNEGALRIGNRGQIVLLAPQVRNEGSIDAKNGQVVLAAGSKAEIFGTDYEGIRFEIQAPEHQTLNLGSIDVEGGAARLFAGTLRNQGSIRGTTLSRDSAGNIVLSARHLLQTGTGSRIEANGQRGGQITLESRDGTTHIEGSVEARGLGGPGGNIAVSGRGILIGSSATLSVTGQQAGGNLHIGQVAGGHGSSIHLAVGSRLDASAVDQGDGGRLLVVAEEDLQADGHLLARGAGLAGHGGFIETSGKRTIAVSQAPDASAPHGGAGTWLIDPDVIDIVPGSAGILGGSVVGASLINAALAVGTSVEVFAQAAPGKPATGVLTQRRGAVLTPSSGTTLTLRADSFITLGSDIDGLADRVTLRAPSIDIIGNIRSPDSLAGFALEVQGAVTQRAGSSITVRTIEIDGGKGDVSLNGAIQALATDGEPLVIQAGRLRLGDVNAQGFTTLDISGSGEQLAGTGIRSGGLRLTGLGTMELSQGDLNNFKLGTDLSAGRLVVTSQGKHPLGTGFVLVGHDATLDLRNGTTRNVTNTIFLEDGAILASSSAGGNSTGSIKLRTPVISFSAPQAGIGDPAAGIGSVAFSHAQAQEPTVFLLPAAGVTLDLGGAVLAAETAGTMNIDHAGAGTVVLPRIVNAQTDSPAGFIVSNGGNLIAGVDPGTGTLNGFGNSTVTVSNGSQLLLNASGASIANGFLVDGGTIRSESTLDLTGDVRLGANGGTFFVAEQQTVKLLGTLRDTASTPGSLTKSGPGTLQTTSASERKGETFVHEGVLSVTNGSALGIGPVTVLADGTLEVDRTTLVNSLILDGNDSLPDGRPTRTPALHILPISPVATPLTSSTDPILLKSDSAIAVDGKLNGATQITQRITNPTGFSGGLIKQDKGRLVLSAANTYRGDTSIEHGILHVDETGSLPSTSILRISSVNNGRLLVDSEFLEVGGLIGDADSKITLGSTTFVVNQDFNSAFAGTISGSGDLVKRGAGTLTLTGINTFDGTTRVDGGELSLAVRDAINSSLVIAPTGVLRIGTDTVQTLPSLDSLGVVEVQGELNLAGGLRAGGGRIHLHRGSVVTMEEDAFILRNGAQLTGEGIIHGPVINDGGVMNLGNSPGALTIFGSFVQTSSGLFIADIQGAIPGTGHDYLKVVGSASLDGGLQLVPGSGIAAIRNAVLNLIEADDGISGNFSSVTGLSSDSIFTTVQPNSFQLHFRALPEDPHIPPICVEE